MQEKPKWPVPGPEIALMEDLCDMHACGPYDDLDLKRLSSTLLVIAVVIEA